MTKRDLYAMYSNIDTTIALLLSITTAKICVQLDHSKRMKYTTISQVNDRDISAPILTKFPALIVLQTCSCQSTPRSATGD